MARYQGSQLLQVTSLPGFAGDQAAGIYLFLEKWQRSNASQLPIADDDHPIAQDLSVIQLVRCQKYGAALLRLQY